MKEPPHRSQRREAKNQNDKAPGRSIGLRRFFGIMLLCLILTGGGILGGALYFQHYSMTPIKTERSLFDAQTLMVTWRALIGRIVLDERPAINRHGRTSPPPDHENDMSVFTVNRHGGRSATPDHGNNVSISTVKATHPESALKGGASKFPTSLEDEGIHFTVKRGESLIRTAGHLQTEGLITHPHLFRLLAKIKGVETQIQAGEYLISPTFSPEQILHMLVNGKVRLHKLTFPEGLTIKEMSRSVERAGFGKAEAFVALASDINLIHTIATQYLGFEAPVTKQPHPISSLEGYLFPDTYLFASHTSQKEIITAMTSRFKTIFTIPWQERCKALGLSIHEVVTLASIIEKETGAAHERPLISSVFHNRLKKGMRLQSDPTVIYGIPDFNGNITRKDLRRPTPYNTYTISGLPPGPIANPGAAALHAALFPEKSDYLYFVSKKDGSHFFSKTLNEHNRAVRKYQLSKTSNQE